MCFAARVTKMRATSSKSVPFLDRFGWTLVAGWDRVGFSQDNSCLYSGMDEGMQ